MKVKLLSRAQLLATPWTATYQCPPPMGFSRQEYWSGVPLPSPANSLRIAILTTYQLLPRDTELQKDFFLEISVYSVNLWNLQRGQVIRVYHRVLMLEKILLSNTYCGPGNNSPITLHIQVILPSHQPIE